MKKTEIPKPWKSSDLLKRQALEPEITVEKPISINLGSFKIPERVKPELIQVEGHPNIFQFKIQVPYDKLKHRTPFDKIPTMFLDTKSLKSSKLDIKPQGIRPLFSKVNFFPNRIDLKLNQRSKPPFDFTYVRDGIPVDRPTNIFAPDDRYIYRDTTFPWCTVGRVDTPLGSGAGCTIGSRLLLTANHLIQWNPDGTAGWVRFRPAYYNGSFPFGEVWGTRVIFWITTTPANGLSDRETAFDYVVCVLDSRIGDIVGYPGYRKYSNDWNGGSYWQHMGYPGDLSGAERPAFQGSCIISSVSSESAVDQNGYVLGHFNDIVGGHSGGPVWGWWGNEPWPRVVGVQSAEASTPSQNTSGDNEFGGGSALNKLITWTRENYP